MNGYSPVCLQISIR